MAYNPNFNLLDTAVGDRVLNAQALDAIQGTQAGVTSTIVSTAGTITLIPAVAWDRAVIINVNVTTTFANGDGAQPTIAIGQTGTVNKFAATSAFTGATAGTTKAFGGTLSANTALIATVTAGTGTTETGATTITAISQSS